MTTYGSADIPLASESGADHLNMAKYAGALAHFVLHCETPMTVGIQGEWGSGKTSLMRMMIGVIEKSMYNNIRILEFETWQYGAVGSDDALGFMLMRRVLRDLARSYKENDESFVLRVARISGKIGKAIALSGAGKAASLATHGIVDPGDLTQAIVPAEGLDDASDLSQIKRDFARIVKQITGGKKGQGRVIVFVDDLDRIRPDKAIALLEIMKNFMDVERCVFVLACDYEVVRRGVELRLGVGDAEKAEAFFHKIIQVPFSMPTHSYNIERMLQEFIGPRVVERKYDSQPLVRMIQEAIGTNPRSLKRFLNRVDLHGCLDVNVVDSAAKMRIGSFVALAGLIALQMRWPRVAAYVTRQKTAPALAKAIHTLRTLLDDVPEEERDASLLVVLDDEYGGGGDEWHGHPQVRRLVKFADLMWRCLDRNRNRELAGDELDDLIRHAERLALTSVEVERDSDSDSDSENSRHVVGATGDNALGVLQNIIGQLWDVERRGLNNLGIYWSGKYFQVRVHKVGILLSAQTESGRLSVHLGENSKEKFKSERVDEVAGSFRSACVSLGVRFSEQRDRTSCVFDMASMPSLSGDFVEVVIDAVRRVNEVLGQPRGEPRDKNAMPNGQQEASAGPSS